MGWEPVQGPSTPSGSASIKAEITVHMIIGRGAGRLPFPRSLLPAESTCSMRRLSFVVGTTDAAIRAVAVGSRQVRLAVHDDCENNCDDCGNNSGNSGNNSGTVGIIVIQWG